MVINMKSEAIEVAKSQALRKLNAEGISIDDKCKAIACLSKCVLSKPLIEAYLLLIEKTYHKPKTL